MKISKYTTVKNMHNEETMQMLAEIWANRTFREYIFNLRNIEIEALKKIKTGTIEGDALELQRGNGRIEAIENLMKTARNCYESFEKIRAKRERRNIMPEETIVDEGVVEETSVEEVVEETPTGEVAEDAAN